MKPLEIFLIACLVLLGVTGCLGAFTEAGVGLWITVETVVLISAGLAYMTFGAPPGKTLAVAQAAYREAIRQPLFWFLLLLFGFFMWLSIYIPYFTLEKTEDLKLMAELSLEAILLPCLILAVFTSSISVSEEIEGRTAITLLSKPVSRRQFLLGKFFGILLAPLFLAVVLTLVMGACVNYKIVKDDLKSESNFNRPGEPAEIATMRDTLSFLPDAVVYSLSNVLLVFAEVHAVAPQIVLSSCQVMILTAVAVALATRLPMVVNLVVCLTVFFMGRLTSLLLAQKENELVYFVAQVFAVLLPGLNYYDIGPAMVSEIEVPWVEYVAPAVLHGVMYSTIMMLLGLILFEDRDVA